MDVGDRKVLWDRQSDAGAGGGLRPLPEDGESVQPGGELLQRAALYGPGAVFQGGLPRIFGRVRFDHLPGAANDARADQARPILGDGDPGEPTPNEGSHAGRGADVDRAHEPAFRDWLLSKQLLDEARVGSPSPWPREVKPTLTMVMTDLSILLAASRLLDEPIYVFGDDAKE